MDDRRGRIRLFRMLRFNNPPPFQLFPQTDKLIGDWKRKILHMKYH